MYGVFRPTACSNNSFPLISHQCLPIFASRILLQSFHIYLNPNLQPSTYFQHYILFEQPASNETVWMSSRGNRGFIFWCFGLRFCISQTIGFFSFCLLSEDEKQNKTKENGPFSQSLLVWICLENKLNIKKNQIKKDVDLGKEEERCVCIQNCKSTHDMALCWHGIKRFCIYGKKTTEKAQK